MSLNIAPAGRVVQARAIRQNFFESRYVPSAPR
jgi:hypothetical protein